MKIKSFLLLLTLLIHISSFAQQIKLVTWNLCNFGKSKSAEEILFIAKQLKDADVVAIQEVSASDFGSQAVAKLADELNRTGAKWDYLLSDPTNGAGSERYAFLFKTSKLTSIGRGFLEKNLDTQIGREPFIAKFKTKQNKTFLLSTIHAVPSAKKPALECQYLYKLDSIHDSENLLLMGDFNLKHQDLSFNSLKNRGFYVALENQKTTLRMKPKPDGNLANPYDNIFYEKEVIKIISSGIIDFSKEFTNLPEARKISDHLPVYFNFEI